jgi:hypothetical protein
MRVLDIVSVYTAGTLCIIGLHTTALAYGQPPTESSRDFFKNNFALSVDGMKGSPQFSDVHPQSESQQAPNEESLENRSQGSIKHDASPVRDTPLAVQTTLRSDTAHLPLILTLPRVQLFVSSADSKHLHDVIHRALTLHRSSKLVLMHIYHIGDYRTLSVNDRKELQESNIPYIATATVPYGQGAKLSPTWVFATPIGMRLVEGVMNPEQYLATNGLEPVSKKIDAMDQPAGELQGW